MIDSLVENVSSPRLADAGASLPAPCGSYLESQEIISKRRNGWGGARPNSGGARVGAGRPRKVAAMSRDMNRPRWYVVRAKRGEASIADREIRTAGFDVLVANIFKPAIPPRRNANGVMRPGRPDRSEFLFGLYIIVSFNLADPSWHVIKSLPGVERIICGGYGADGVGIPLAVRDEAIDLVREQLDANGCLYPPGHRGEEIPVGTALRVVDGPLPDRPVLCEMSDGKRVMFLMEMFNRPVRVTVAQARVATE